MTTKKKKDVFEVIQDFVDLMGDDYGVEETSSLFDEIVGYLPTQTVYAQFYADWECPSCGEKNTAQFMEKQSTCQSCLLQVEVVEA